MASELGVEKPPFASSQALGQACRHVSVMAEGAPERLVSEDALAPSALGYAGLQEQATKLTGISRRPPQQCKSVGSYRATTGSIFK